MYRNNRISTHLDCVMEFYLITWLFFITLINLYLHQVVGDPIEKKLIEKILSNYSSLERPVLQHRDPLVVHMKFTLQQIVDVDERNQIITTNAWLDLKWHDFHWAWNRDDYNNITKIRVPYKYMWTPDILLYNSADSKFDSTTHTPIVIDHKGNCLFVPPGLFKSTCKIDVSNFPFDEQKCTIKFGVWSYNAQQVDLRLQAGGGTDLTEYIESGEWRLLEVVANRNEHEYECCPESYVDVTFILIMRRRTMYYVINLILPCILNSILTLLTFLLPAAAAEKITLAITVLLAQIVFMLLIMETMPPTSDAIPLISKYFACSLITVCASVGGTVWVLSFNYISPEIDGSLSPRLKKFLLYTAPKFVNMPPFPRKLASLKLPIHKKSPSYAKETENPLGEDLPLKISRKQIKRERYQQSLRRKFPISNQLNHSFGRNGGTSDSTTSPNAEQAPTPRNIPSDNKSYNQELKDLYFSINSQNGSECGKACNEQTRNTCQHSMTHNSQCSCSARQKICKKQISIESNDILHMKDILKDVRSINNKLEENRLREEMMLEWQYASRVLDKILMWVFSLFVVGTTLATLCAVPNISEAFSM